MGFGPPAARKLQTKVFHNDGNESDEATRPLNSAMFLQDYLIGWLIQFCHWRNVLWLCESLGLIDLPKRISYVPKKPTALTTFKKQPDGLRMVFERYRNAFWMLSTETKFGIIGTALMTVAGAYLFYRQIGLARRKNSQEDDRNEHDIALQKLPIYELPVQTQSISSSNDRTLRLSEGYGEESLGLPEVTCSDGTEAQLNTSLLMTEVDETTSLQDTLNLDDISLTSATASETLLDQLLPFLTIPQVVDVGQLCRFLSVQKCDEVQEEVFLFECLLPTGQTETLRLAVTRVTPYNYEAIRSELSQLMRMRSLFNGEHPRLARHLPIIREIVAVRDTLAKLSLRRSDSHKPEKEYIAIASLDEAEIAFSDVFKDRDSVQVLTSTLEQANLSIALMRSIIPGMVPFRRFSLVPWPIDVEFDVDADHHVVVRSHGVLIKHCPELLRLGTSLTDFQTFTSDVLRGVGVMGDAEDEIDISYCTKIFFSLGATPPLDKLLSWRRRYFQAKRDRIAHESGDFRHSEVSR